MPARCKKTPAKKPRSQKPNARLPKASAKKVRGGKRGRVMTAAKSVAVNREEGRTSLHSTSPLESTSNQGSQKSSALDSIQKLFTDPAPGTAAKGPAEPSLDAVAAIEMVRSEISPPLFSPVKADMLTASEIDNMCLPCSPIFSRDFMACLGKRTEDSSSESSGDDSDTEATNTAPRRVSHPGSAGSVAKSYFDVPAGFNAADLAVAGVSNKRQFDLLVKEQEELEKTFVYERLLASNSSQGLEQRTTEEHGRGVFATKQFEAGDFVVEYKGTPRRKREYDRIRSERRSLEDSREYAFQAWTGFKWLVIDATEEDQSFGLGRLINHAHAKAKPNCQPVLSKNKQRVFFVATQKISVGEQIFYDYNERNPEIVKDNPFLRPPARADEAARSDQA